jgi:hypothetical protein
MPTHTIRVKRIETTYVDFTINSDTLGDAANKALQQAKQQDFKNGKKGSVEHHIIHSDQMAVCDEYLKTVSSN